VVLAWLEADGRVRVEREEKMVFVRAEVDDVEG
jgi:hypothetical protein